MLEMIHAAVTWALAGLIWTVQLVHYPLFTEVGPERFPNWHRRHVTRMSLLVAPLMLLEAALGAALLFGTHRSDPLAWAGFALVAINAISSALIQAPLHVRLKTGYDEALVRRLVVTNWIRTGAWSVRGILALAMIGTFPSVSR